MAYPIKRKIDTGFPKQVWSIDNAVQNKINHLLYEVKQDEGLETDKPKLLTIIIRKDKEHHFHFLRDNTEFFVRGRWKDITHKHKPKHFLIEKNAKIEIQYLDNKKGTITRKLKKLFKQYNKNIVKEKVLYVTAEPLEMTSLDLKKGR